MYKRYGFVFKQLITQYYEDGQTGYVMEKVIDEALYTQISKDISLSRDKPKVAIQLAILNACGVKYQPVNGDHDPPNSFIDPNESLYSSDFDAKIQMQKERLLSLYQSRHVWLCDSPASGDLLSSDQAASLIRRAPAGR